MNGKRKFILACTVILLSAGMVFAGKMDAPFWVQLALGALAIFAGANVVDKMKGGQG